MTSARKAELSRLIRSAYIAADPHIREVLLELVDEVKPVDDTRPHKCVVCGRITYFDIVTERHRCQYCGS